MKNKWFIIVLIFMLSIIFTSCDTYEDYSDKDAFRLSSIFDVSDENGKREYFVYAPYTDTFTITSENHNVESITLYQSGKKIYEEEKKIVCELTENEIYKLVIKTYEENKKIELEVKAKAHKIEYPYGVDSGNKTSIDVKANEAAYIEYTKREGGKYIYSNNPELVPGDSVNTAFIQTKDLDGEVFFTFEHANYSGTRFYLGYQLKNEGDSDVYITVTNIGYQVGGTWFGQNAWYDFYNTSFKLPSDYLTETNTINPIYQNYDYAYSQFKPRVFKPTTYRLPAGEYFYVIGGTSDDSYNNIDVADTADKKVATNQCTNGNVKFNVTGGKVTATFYCYTSVKKLDFEAEQVGYRVGAYSAQYVGIANHSGVIDTNITWKFDDTTKSGNLPVSYKNKYDDNPQLTKTPYAEYNNKEHLHENKSSWMTNLNPQNDHNAVGSDIVDFICVDENGNNVVIDNYHADGGGNPSNTANWMIEYQEHYTLINEGSVERTITLYKKDGGTLAILLRDSNTGEVIDTYYTIGQAKMGYSFEYPIKVKAGQTVEITLSYVLVACSYGNVTHWATIK